MFPVEPLTLGIVGLVMLFVLLFLGVHIGVALSLVGLTGTAILVGFDSSVSMLSQAFFYIVAKFTFITVPLFLFAGLLASRGPISGDLYNALSVLAGRFRSALGIATVASCTGFGVLCGSSLVTASVFARVSAPEMRRHGYDKNMAYGIVSTAGMIGMLIPPSVLAIIYAALSEESIGKLFIAGIGPGIVLAAVMVVGLIIMSLRKPENFGEPAPSIPWRQRLSPKYAKAFLPLLITGGILIGGILGGIFTPTEAGAVACIVLMVLVIIATGRDSWKEINASLAEAVSTSAMVFFVIGSAQLFARFLALTGLSTKLVTTVIDMDLSLLGFMVAMCIIYLILGCFLDSISMLSLTIPVVYPTVMAMGVDPIYFAMVVILAIEIGVITPPVGLNVYAVKAVAEPDVSLEDIFRGVFPFFLMTLVCLIVTLLFPPVSTFLPSLMVKK